MSPAALAVAVILALGQAANDPTTAQELAAVRQLYATAAYEDALTRLSLLDGRIDQDYVDQYRALCLIGLGRVADAEQTLERIVLRSPSFEVAPRDASPAFMARFAAVRTRVLPVAATRLYMRAKTSYDVQDYNEAAALLEQLVDVVRREPPSADTTLATLQQSAEGLLRLTDAQRSAASRVVYSARDVDVTPPVQIDRALPPWNPPAAVAWRSFRGVVEVIVDEQGSVEGAALVQSLADFYDASLLATARTWRFRPAERGGRPVKYRKLVEITMRPR